MHIKSVTIDGFKSYGKKVDLSDFDKQFTAITGLNGSGKSNILDAINFVLGSNDMKLARCNNLRDLIYKMGQAGVVKASVAITFDNRDPRNCPPSYEAYPEIVVRREVNMNSRSKYFINGFVANTNQVHDLFHAVQLNINNPHFLIMQGRITKVLNMKPPEILAMVEEATGASRYELKKKNSQNLIERKDVAIKAIDLLLTEQIGPNLNRLKQQMAGLQDYKRVTAELEHQTKVLIAYQFVQNQELCAGTEADVNEKKDQITQKQEEMEQIKQAISETQEKIVQLEREKDEECGGRLSEMEIQLKEHQLEEGKASSHVSNLKDSLNDVVKKKKSVLKHKDDDEKVIRSKEAEYNKLRETFDVIEKEANDDAVALQKAQEDYEAISAGASKAADGEAAATLADQLIRAKSESANLETQFQTAAMDIKHMRGEVDKKRKEMRHKEGSYEEDSKRFDVMQKEVKKMETALNKLPFNEDAYRDLRNQRKELADTNNILRHEIENLEHENNVNFNYSNRNLGPNFDDRKVHGMVAKLIRVTDAEAATALEVAAGGKLYNVVVSDQETAKTLLERGNLQRNTTFLPLDRIQGRTLDRNKLRKAEELVGRNNVKPALSLVEFDPQYEEAMKFVFSDTLICTDMEIAKKVTFTAGIGLKTVTLAGDVFDPSGTLSGGSRNQSRQLLQDMVRLQARIDELNHKMQQQKDVEDQLRVMDSQRSQYTDAKRAFEMKSTELDLLKKNMETTNYHMIQEEIKDMEARIVELEQFRKEYPAKRKQFDSKINDLEKKMKTSDRKQELKDAETALKRAQTKADKSRKTMDQNKRSVETLRIEIDELKQGIAAFLSQITELEAECESHEQEVRIAEKNVTAAGKKVEEVQKQINAQKRQLKAKSDEIHKLYKEKEKRTKQVDNIKLDIRKLEHRIEEIERLSGDAARNVKILLKSHPWINEEKKDFGNEAAGYPFKRTDFNPDNIKKKVEELKSKKASLSKTVNMRANVALVDKEKEYEEVVNKRKIVENDKKNLLDYMKDVDEKRKDELKKAFVVINNHFGNIFKSLLPGTDAKLQAPPGKTIHDGLEVKVAFGDVWKESLTELSGGQRSLVALSLVLALLRYNPAPIYILDEVDAALDQSHTTNIGGMIKANFPDSQVSNLVHVCHHFV
jgi:structural maintenance of chromosome 2